MPGAAAADPDDVAGDASPARSRWRWATGPGPRRGRRWRAASSAASFLSTLVTLVIVPVFYVLFDRFGTAFMKMADTSEPDTTGEEMPPVERNGEPGGAAPRSECADGPCPFRRRAPPVWASRERQPRPGPEGPGYEPKPPEVG